MSNTHKSVILASLSKLTASRLANSDLRVGLIEKEQIIYLHFYTRCKNYSNLQFLYKKEHAFQSNLCWPGIWTKSKIQHFSQETVPNNPWQIWPGIFGNNKKAKLCIFSPLSPFKFNSCNSVHNVKSNHHIADRKEHNKNLKI